MENASKALLIAAGVLIVMLVVTLLIFGWKSYSDYFMKKQELENIDDLAKFNEQFESYERDDVMGYEIISLANKVADYNERFSNDPSANNDKKYTPITLEVDLGNSRKDLSYDNTNRLFKKNLYTQSSTKNEIKNVIETASEFENQFNKREVAAKVAKNIKTLVKSEVENYYKGTLKLSDKEIEDKIVGDFNAITGENVNSYSEVENYIKGNNGNKIYAYYEYYQFKRLQLKCDNSSIKYDDTSGRISYMKFISTGKII